MNSPSVVNGVCPHDCPDACGIRASVKGGRVTAIKGDPDNAVTQGWVCAKVAPYLERVYHPERVLYPLRRVGEKGGGKWQRISWPEAIETIARRWRNIARDAGAEAILPYSYSGTMGLVQMTAASTRFWNRLGASRLERSICMAASRLAVRSTLGARRSPSYQQVLYSQLIILWAHNPLSTAPHLMPYLQQARRRGATIVLIDPYRSRSARGVDIHLQPRPGTDAVLALSMACEMHKRGLINVNWVEKHCFGWREYLQRIAEYPAARAAEICDLKTSEIVRLAELYGSISPAMIRIGDGVNRHQQGGQTVRAIACLPALTGQYGRRGGGLGCSTGDYFNWDEEAINHWSDCPQSPGRIVNMNRLGAALNGEARNPPILALYVFGANPAVSAPNGRLIRSGLLRRRLFTVVHELFMTDTARYADIILPATTQLEHCDLHRGYGHTLLQYNCPAIRPQGEARSNWDVMRELARAMGFTDYWLQQSADEVISEVLAATARENPCLEGISLKRLRNGAAVSYAHPDDAPFHDLRFATPSGRIELYSAAFGAECGDPLPGWKPTIHGDPPDGVELSDALQLLSPAAHHFTNSSLANLPTLRKKEGLSRIEINAEDARMRKLKNNQLVEVFNQHGGFKTRVEISTRVRLGVALSFKGFWQADYASGSVNFTTSDTLADAAGQSTFHSNLVWIRPAFGHGPTRST